MDGFKGWVNGWKEKKGRGGLVGFGWEWKSEGVDEGWGGVGEVTLLINDRASSSIERW
jgi:hypothetical protein